jgi:hypothetical protein
MFSNFMNRNDLSQSAAAARSHVDKLAREQELEIMNWKMDVEVQ